VMELPGITAQMAIKMGEGDVKSVEDVAGLVSDDLRGWFEVKNGEKTRFPGLLEGMGVTAEIADAMIMAARVQMGWVEAPPVPETPETLEPSDVKAEVTADEQE
jgi:transcription termination/antitermination protein NusA